MTMKLKCAGLLDLCAQDGNEGFVTLRGRDVRMDGTHF